jgi:hypothetical protein
MKMFNRTGLAAVLVSAVCCFSSAQTNVLTYHKDNFHSTFEIPEWALEKVNPVVLHAYDANNISVELYNGSCNGGGIKWIPPTIADSKVFVPTATGCVFGLLQ